jgi:hypothetical protein
MRHKDKIIATVTAVVAVAVIICAIVIACMRLGIVEGYDFGAGAYYYADIPDFKDVVREDVYQTDIPIWVHIGLFLIWGWLMYRLWKWVDMH